MILKSFEDMKNMLKDTPSKKKLAVVNAVDEHTVEAVILAKKQKLVSPLLIGDKNSIIKILNKFKEDPADYEIIQVDSPVAAAKKAVELVRNKGADSILKGAIQTSDFMRAVVSSESGIKAQKLLSHVCLNQVDNYHKIIFSTDGAMVLEPTFDEKLLILKNALFVLHKLGYEKPKVGVVESNEIINLKQKNSIEAAKIKDLYEKGEISGCIVEGPISIDLALDKEACRIKKYSSDVAGDVDLLLCQQITVANVIVKSFQTVGNGKVAGVVVGALAPIVLVSRASSTEEKFNSIILSLLVS